MSTLISMVGLRPGAIAATAKTLQKNTGLQHVILLPTEETNNNANSLKDYLNGLSLKTESLIIPMNPLGQARSGKPVWELIRSQLDRSDLNPPVYLDISPGLNYQVALISHHLKDEKRIQPLYADYARLHSLEDGNAWNLEDIGLDALLTTFHGLSWDNRARKIKGGERELDLLAVKEYRGRLHGLARVWKERTPGAAQRVREEARRYESFIKNPAQLNHLQLDLTVWTNDRYTEARFQSYGTRVINKSDLNEEAATSWWQVQMKTPPGGRSPGDRETPLEFENDSPVTPPDQLAGSWTGDNLIVSLGTDPSATLLAIFTHKPKRLIILTDPDTLRVKAMANRICGHLGDMETSEVSFWPVNLLGGGTAVDALKQKLEQEQWIANITPGTKAQSWMMAGLPVFELWSLMNRERKAVKIAPFDPSKSIGYVFPPITLQAAVNGGQLKETGRSAADLFLGANGADRRPFLTSIGNIIAQAAKNDVNGTIIRRGVVLWASGSILEGEGANHVRCISTPAMPPGGPPKSPDCYEGDIELEVVLNGRSALRDIIKGRWDWKVSRRRYEISGTWLEEPIAAAFIAAQGSAERVHEMRLGQRWRWSTASISEDYESTEMDVILRWQGHYVCIECKLGGRDIPDGQLDLWKATLMTEARSRFGRYAIPVLVRGRIPRDELKKTAQDSIRKDGLLEIGLGLLNQRETLRNLVGEAIANARTTDASSIEEGAME